jgi:hypothetical protein
MNFASEWEVSVYNSGNWVWEEGEPGRAQGASSYLRVFRAQALLAVNSPTEGISI